MIKVIESSHCKENSNSRARTRAQVENKNEKETIKKNERCTMNDRYMDAQAGRLCAKICCNMNA